MKKIVVIILIFFILLVQSTPVFADDAAEEDLYERVIAHGGGSYKGYETTNSVEALNHSILSGYKYIELDMEFSSDGKIIMLHDWDRTAQHYYGRTFDKKISLSKFLNLSVHGELEVLTFDKLYGILKTHKELKVITDTKGDNLKLLEAIAKNYPGVKAQIIPQIYDYDQWSKVKELGFDDMIFTLYTMAVIDTEKLISFVKEKEIYAVTMPDYVADKGICAELAGSGIKVYVHPVSEYEDALRYMELGAWGIYSGTLLPEEFSGESREYYLAVSGGGSVKKLTDERIDGFDSFSVHGLQAGDIHAFYLDGAEAAASGQDLVSLIKGKHRLTVRIQHGDGSECSQDYLLWKDSRGLRLLQKKYEYRLDAVKNGMDFDSVISETNLSDELQAVLERALIAKKGEYLFYYQGKPNRYMNGDEFLPVQQSRSGELLLPLNTTAKRLGADSVSMDKTRDITVIYSGERSMVMADSSLIRNGFQITRMKQPVTLYMNKAMAGGEFYQYIAGVTCLEEDGLILLLPGDFKQDNNSRTQMMQAAARLFIQ